MDLFWRRSCGFLLQRGKQQDGEEQVAFWRHLSDCIKFENPLPTTSLRDASFNDNHTHTHTNIHNEVYSLCEIGWAVPACETAFRRLLVVDVQLDLKIITLNCPTMNGKTVHDVA